MTRYEQQENRQFRMGEIVEITATDAELISFNITPSRLENNKIGKIIGRYRKTPVIVPSWGYQKEDILYKIKFNFPTIVDYYIPSTFLRRIDK